jgi:tetratricopeptide (TPR) repeat protein
VPSAKSKPLLEGAAKDYQALLDREDGLFSGSTRTLALGNLAETHMMLGNIDEAIDTYQTAKKLGARASTLYGLAVAFDRDDRQTDAYALIRSLGAPAYEEFSREYALGAVFFVPAGEEEYYFALCDEAFGHGDTAIEHWKAFLRSGAHPKFQPRAKEHLDRLLARKNLKWEVPLVRELDPGLIAPNPYGRTPTPPRPRK